MKTSAKASQFCHALLQTKLLMVAIVLFSGAGSVRGQDVLGNGDFPANWVNSFAPNLTDPGTRINQGNVTAAVGSNAGVGSAYQSRRLQITATATENGDATRDRFSFTLGASQDFQVLAGGADLWAPTYLRGAINFFQNAGPPNANFAVGSISGSAEFLEWDGVNYVSFGAPKIINFSLTREAQINPGGGNIDETQMLKFNGAPAGQYRLQIRMTGTGEADKNFAGNSNNGSGVTTTANAANADDRYSGLISSLGYAPSAALPDSRARVNAPAARTQYGVDGTGSSIGLLEPGRIIDTHTTFGGGKVTQLRQRLDQPAGLTDPADANTRVADGRSEHATAVGGIAAGLAGNDGQKGIAPAAGLISVASAAYVDDANKTSGQKQFDGLLSAGATVINMSAFYGDLPATYVDQQMASAAHSRVTFVKSSGNSGIAGAGGNTITNPGMAYNMITVGALRQDMTRTAAFSSTNETAGTLRKPDIVAPGDYVVIPNAIDTGGVAGVNDFDRRFTGSDARYLNSSPTTGGASGTSFAAPHVAGAVALMQDYSRRHVEFDADSIDNRVMKAVLLNAADRTVTHGDGAAWTQMKDPAGTTVTESLDRQLGAGMLDVSKSLRNYSAGEIRQADNNNQQNFKITGPAGTDILAPANQREAFWDLEKVAAKQAAQTGKVDYILGSNAQLHFIAESQTWAGTVTPNFNSLFATLTWDRLTNAAGDAYEDLANLELRLYVDGLNDGNIDGFDPANPTADTLLMQTSNAAENVKLLALDYVGGPNWTFNTAFGAVPPTFWDPDFYLEVINLSTGAAVDYGLAVVPEPASVVLLGFGIPVFGLHLVRRHRARSLKSKPKTVVT